MAASVVVAAGSAAVDACAVCFGLTPSTTARSAYAGVLVLLVFAAVVLSVAGGFFARIVRRANQVGGGK